MSSVEVKMDGLDGKIKYADDEGQMEGAQSGEDENG